MIDLAPRTADAARGSVAGHEQAIRILLEVADSMSAADGVRAALNRLAALALRATGADRCAIFVLDTANGSRLRPAAAASRIGDRQSEWQRFKAMESIDVDADPALASIWSGPRVVTLEDAQGSTLVPERWRRAWGARSLALAPLHAGGEAYGVLTVDYATTPHGFTPDEVKLLDAIASAAGVALRGARLVEDLKRSVEIERRLSECTAAVQSGRSLRDVLEVIADQFAFLLPGTACSINLLNPDHTAFTPAVVRGSDPVGGEIRIDELPSDDVEEIRAAWERDPRRAIVVPSASRLTRWRSLIPPHIGAGMLLPFSDGDRVLGFVAIGRDNRAFDDAEVRVATAFADQAALAVAKAGLHDALEGRLRAIQILYELTDVVLRTSDLRAALNSLNEGVGREMGVECVRVTFADRTLATALHVRAPTAVDLETMKAWRKEGRTTPAVLGTDLVAPIPIGGRVAGILWLRALRDVDPATTNFVSAIAGGLGEVAYKAKLRRAVERRSQELAVAAERERIARDLHDTAGQTFYGIGLKLQDLLSEVEDERLAERLGELRALSAQAVSDVRSAVYALSFLHVRARGFVPSLRMLARQFTRGTGVTAQIVVTGRIPKLTEEVQSALYRVAHEAMINVDRHARATGVVVMLEARNGEMHLSIRDDGVGLDQRQVADWRSAAHFGMRTMARAVQEVGGRFHVTAATPRGLLVNTAVPLRAGR